jgi:hypothetical protein
MVRVAALFPPALTRRPRETSYAPKPLSEIVGEAVILARGKWLPIVILQWEQNLDQLQEFVSSREFDPYV